MTVVGGRSTAEITGGQIANEVARSVVRFQKATAFSEGIYDDLKGHFAATLGEREHATLTATTKVSAEVNGLEVGLDGEVRMMIKRLRGGFTSRSASSNAETPVQLDSDTKFDGVTFIDKSGKAFTLVVEVEPSVFRDYDTFSALTGAASESKFISKFGHTLFLGEVGSGKTVPTAPTLIRTDGGAVQGTIVRPPQVEGRAVSRGEHRPARQERREDSGTRHDLLRRDFRRPAGTADHDGSRPARFANRRGFRGWRLPGQRCVGILATSRGARPAPACCS